MSAVCVSYLRRGVFLHMRIAMVLVLVGIGATSLFGQDEAWQRYFERQVADIEQKCLSDVTSGEQWLAQRGERRRELQQMLGLEPWPERTPLKPVITKTVERDGIVVENLHFQSMPGLYVTANLYRPRAATEKLPAVLYVCGHGREVVDDVSVGNKTHYQHHGAWLARHGYVCMAIDTVQLGEIEGVHHGTYRLDMWWWLSRGYTPAGVEAWNGIRALDYLQSRSDVDPERIGMTGRSGGGAYSWWVAALDERIKVAVPVAGITNMRDHVVNGCVEGHCDCMYFVNTYRWDFPLVAALVAPRPLLIANTDKDTIFPLSGVVDVYNKTRRIYRMLGAEDKIGLAITEGPHKDTQELQVPALRWLNRHLKQDESLISIPAEPLFDRAELKVLNEVPGDQLNTTIQESFVPASQTVEVPSDSLQWNELNKVWNSHLKNQVFRAWPVPFGEHAPRVVAQSEGERIVEGLRVQTYRLRSEMDVELSAWVVTPAAAVLADSRALHLQVVDDMLWANLRSLLAEGTLTEGKPDQESVERIAGEVGDRWGNRTVSIYFAPRGVGPGKWTEDVAKQRQILRRFYLVGQTWEAMQIWDVCQLVRAIGEVEEAGQLPLTIEARGTMAGIALYAALSTPGIAKLSLVDLPQSHREGPQLLNVVKGLDVQQAVALALERTTVELRLTQPAAQHAVWDYPAAVARLRQWPADRFRIITP